MKKGFSMFEFLDWPEEPLLAAGKLRDWCQGYDIRLAAPEKVGARPGQGVVSRFTFGQNLGMWQGILSPLLIPYRMPTPQQWRKGLVDGRAGSTPKEQSPVTARRPFPDAPLARKKDVGRAEALLLAVWARGNAQYDRLAGSAWLQNRLSLPEQGGGRP
jgi:hypothetical protein